MSIFERVQDDTSSFYFSQWYLKTEFNNGYGNDHDDTGAQCGQVELGNIL
jgi:hypothetical protein